MDTHQLLKLAELVRLMADTVRFFIQGEPGLDGEMGRLAAASLTLDSTAAELADIAGRLREA